MKRIQLLACTLLTTASVWAQTDPVVMTINGVDVPRSEFEYSFNKNNGEGVIDKKTVEEYVDLYINYKLKVAAALDARLDTMQSFKEEFALYRDQQVRPSFVTDADILTEARHMYDRLAENCGTKGLVLPAHILLRLSTQATASEQERVRQRIDSVYQALQKGADFADLARRASQDAYSSSNGGRLDWIMPNQAYKEIEDVTYALQPGQISRPFLSPVGWHIIKLIDRKQLEPFDSLKSRLVRNLEQQGIRDAIIDYKLKRMVDDSQGSLTREQILARRSDSLSATDNEMKYLIQEYHDGLLLYEMSSREVWDKAESDEAALVAWFETHKKDYAWDEPRFKGIAYHVKDKKDIKAVKNCVKRLPFNQWAEALRQTFNPDSVIRIRVEKGLFKPGDNPTIDRLVFKTGSSVNTRDASLSDFPYDAVYGKKLKKHPEDYSDVRPQVVADFQQELERRWVASLRRRYPVQVNEEVLKTVNKH